MEIFGVDLRIAQDDDTYTIKHKHHDMLQWFMIRIQDPMLQWQWSLTNLVYDQAGGGIILLISIEFKFYIREDFS